MQTTGVSRGAADVSWASASSVCWPLTASSTTRVGVPVQRHAGSVTDRDGQGDGLVGRLEDEARRRSALAVVAPGHERDVVAPLEEAGPDGAPDGTGPEDDEAHAWHSATCRRAKLSGVAAV